MSKNVGNFIKELAKAIHTAGGTIYYVGGYVRDKYTGKENKDIDVEVFNLSQEDLVAVLKTFGHVDLIGESFGVYMVKGYDVDIALPRREVSTGISHQDFEVIPDGFMSLKESGLRRDLTINTLMEDVLTGELIDNFGGVSDIEQGIVRMTNKKTFVEDPLRIYRAAQFASRFNMAIDSELMEVATTIDISKLANERVYEEFKKALLKADKPSIAVRYMADMKIFERLYPKSFIDFVAPNFEQALNKLDASVKNRGNVNNPTAYLVAMFFSECSPRDSVKQMAIFLRKLTNEHDTLSQAANYLGNFILFQNILASKSNTLDKVVSIRQDILTKWNIKNIKDMMLDKATNSTSVTKALEDFPDMDNGVIKPYVTGKDLLDLGLETGPEIGKHLAECLKLQTQGLSKNSIMNHVKSNL